MASLYDRNGRVVARADEKVRLFSPQPGWVEQDPYELLQSIYTAVRKLIKECDLKPGQIECLGLANQGETLLAWDVQTGEPVYNAIGWQCTRSADVCDRLKQDGFEPEFHHKTGLPIDPEWPATKIPWLLKNVPQAKSLLGAGRLAFGQLDSWFVHQLTQEKWQISDHSTAARSGFYHLKAREWIDSLVFM